MCSLSDLHTEAVQAALAKYKERKMPMPSKRRSVLVQSSVEACTPPGETSERSPHWSCAYRAHIYAHSRLLNRLPRRVRVKDADIVVPSDQRRRYHTFAAGKMNAQFNECVYSLEL